MLAAKRSSLIAKTRKTANMIDRNKSNHRNPKGTTLVEIIIVVVLIIVFIPAVLNMFISARKISGQAYIQHQAAVTLGETNDILRFMRNQSYDLLVNGEFYLIRNPGTNSWLVKSDMPNPDTYERHIIVSTAKRHTGTNDLYLAGGTGASYDDPDTKKIDIQILWDPSYLPLDMSAQTIYITNWQHSFTYPAA